MTGCVILSPFGAKKRRVHVGKLAFAQLLDHLSWKAFGRIVERHGGNHRVRGYAYSVLFQERLSRALAAYSVQDRGGQNAGVPHQ
ncbi:DUF4372 domain-containing protein [Pelomicrobium methylotrophicum]|uniref:DUF4372 domain-containing protein n=1 Tax=Pelomicrobium methylotrophicum TaxID=2602750 RepID=A0A5C7EJ63_9PROT|nr:DUF4372 domain-containing protein [Pelomicrobium methylotrophicum]